MKRSSFTKFLKRSPKRFHVWFFLGLLILVVGGVFAWISYRSNDAADSSETDLSNYEIVVSSRPGYQTLIHEGASFQIDYPETWTVTPISITVPVLLKSSKEDENDAFFENASISVEDFQDYSKNVTLDDYASSSFSQLSQLLKNYQVLEQGARSFGQYPGYYFLGTHSPQEGLTVQTLSLFTLLENKAYVFTYTSDPAHPQKYTVEVQTIIDSFKVL